MRIEVKDQRQRFALITVIDRSPRQHAGWESITYKGARYQLFGGIRVPSFIDLSNPLKSRKDTHHADQ